MGYSLCMIVDIENGPISRIFSAFWSGFFHFALNNSQMICKRDFDMFVWNFSFSPKVRILHGL